MTSDPRTGTEAREAADLRETCREWSDETTDRCHVRAEFILWGKLFPPEALGPRCYDHAAAHVGWVGMSRIDQWAVYDLRPINRLAALAAVPAPTDEGRAREALAFVDEFLAVAGNGEGWTVEHVQAVVSWALGRDLDNRQRMLARGVLGSDLIDAAAVPASAPTGETREGLAAEIRALADWCDKQRQSPTTADLRALAGPAAAPVPAPATDGPPSAPTGEGTDAP